MLDVGDWGVEEVLGWVVAVAAARLVPVEDVELHRFLGLDGRKLTVSSALLHPFPA